MYDKRKLDTAIRDIHCYVSDARLAYRKKKWHTDQSEVHTLNRNYGEAEYVMAYGDVRVKPYYGEDEMGHYYAFLLFKVVSFTPGKIEYPLMGKPKVIPPSLIVQDQGGKTFEFFELHRATFRTDSSLDLEKMLDEKDANGVCLTLCDRLYKLIDANNIVPECIPYSNSFGVRIKPLNRFEAANKLEQWKTNKNRIAAEIRANHQRVMADLKEYQRRQKKVENENQRKLNNLDNMFK